MTPALGRIIIYAKDVGKMRDFYETFFGFKSEVDPNDRIVELKPSGAGAAILLHPAGKGLKTGQAIVKLVFDVKDVSHFRDASLAKGLNFGAIHQADGYVYSNAKDPEKNSVQISSRSFAVSKLT